MADLALSTTVGASSMPTFPTEIRSRNYQATEAISIGQLVYLVAGTGKVGLADANASGKHQVIGVAMETKAAGETLSVLEQGDYYGLDLSSLSFGAPVYLSDTAGAFSGTAGTATIPVGRVQPINQVHQIVKSVYVFCAPNIIQS